MAIDIGEPSGVKLGRRLLTCSVAVAALCLGAALAAGTANAQSLQPPSTVIVPDSLGVDMSSMAYSFHLPALSIGSGGSGFNRAADALTLVDDIYFGMTQPVYTVSRNDGQTRAYLGVQVTFGGHSEINEGAVMSGSTWLYDKGENVEGHLTSLGYYAHDGSFVQFGFNSTTIPNCTYTYDARWSMVTKVTKPDGEILNYYYVNDAGTCVLKTITSSLGWMMRYSGKDTPSAAVVRLINQSVDYCDPNAISCAFSRDWYYLAQATSDNYTYNLTQSGIPIGTYTITAFSGDGNYNPTVITKVVYPSGRAVNITYWDQTDMNIQHYGGNSAYASSIPYKHSRVKTIQIGSSIWNYDHTGPMNAPPDPPDPGLMPWTTTTTVTAPDGTAKSISRYWDELRLRPNKFWGVTDELGRNYDAWTDYGSIASPTLGRVTSGQPLGQAESDYTYDRRGNITQITHVAAYGSGLSNTVETAGYDSVCSNYITCNKPNWIKDANGNETDYTYDPTHGGVLTETGPADSNGVRPQKRYSYTQLTAKIKDASGNLVNTTPVWRLTMVSSCQTATAANSASCVGTAAETVTTYAYNTNNLLLTSETVAAGDGSASATTSYGYDDYGNRIWVDGPRTDVDDRSYTTYDTFRRPVYEIGVLPGGSGSPHRTVIHHVYDSDGHEIRTETGYASSDATDGSDFVVSSFKRMTYDATTGLLVKTEAVLP